MNAPHSSSAAAKRLPKWARILLWSFGGLIAIQVAATLGVRGLATKYGGTKPLNAQIQMKNFAATLAVRRAVGLPYPSTIQGLEEVFKQTPKHLPQLSPETLEKQLKDPWGRAYVYYYPGKHNRGSYDLLSLGPDGQEGTEDDITNW